MSQSATSALSCVSPEAASDKGVRFWEPADLPPIWYPPACAESVGCESAGDLAAGMATLAGLYIICICAQGRLGRGGPAAGIQGAACLPLLAVLLRDHVQRHVKKLEAAQRPQGSRLQGRSLH